MNMFKKNGGFTLVELIVVIAILAILAGVAVPAYSGYISKANEAADYTQLDSVKTAAIFAVTEADPAATVTEIVVTAATATDAATVTVDYTTTTDADNDGAADNGTDEDITTAVAALTGGSIPAFKSGAATATWTTAGWDLQ